MFGKELVGGGVANAFEEGVFVEKEGCADSGGGKEDAMIEGIFGGVRGGLRVYVGPSGECIGFFAKSPGSVANGEVEGGEEFGPAGLTMTELLCRREVLEVVVVGVHLDGVIRPFQVRPPLAKGLDDCVTDWPSVTQEGYYVIQ